MGIWLLVFLFEPMPEPPSSIRKVSHQASSDTRRGFSSERGVVTGCETALKTNAPSVLFCLGLIFILVSSTHTGAASTKPVDLQAAMFPQTVTEQIFVGPEAIQRRLLHLWTNETRAPHLPAKDSEQQRM